MTRFALTIEYDGRPFMGWQRQPHGPTVQSTIEDALARLTGQAIVLHAAGRTDAGVHARAMVAHCDIAKNLPPFRLTAALNALVRPAPVAVLAARAVDDDFHARFSCVGRHYCYHIATRRAPLTWQRGLVWRVSPPLDVAAMQVAAAMLVGHHDFTTFRSVHCQAASAQRTLDRLDVTTTADGIVVAASARSFLHHQVRSMVGCLVLVGLGRWPIARMADALAARDRTALGLNAPPDGLYFERADYS